MKTTTSNASGRSRIATVLCPVLLVAIAAAWTSPGLARAQSGSGIDCECTSVGDYLDPDNGSAPKVNPDSTSPNGTYRLEISVVSPTVYVTVRRVSNNAVVYSTNFQENSDPKWGFSPDDDRFVHQYIEFGTHHVTLVDLVPTPGQTRWTTAVATSGSRVRFSTNGNWLLYAALTSTTHTSLQIVEASTGALAYGSEFDFQPVPDPDEKWGMVNWGFSPDSLDRTFVYAFLTGPSSVEWTVVNLQRHSVVRDASLTGISSFWQFSPCGDNIGLVLQTTPTVLQVQLYRTIGNQSPVSSATIALGDPVGFRATSASHIINVGGVDHVLAANNADAICAIVPASLVITPDSVYGGTEATGMLTLNAPAGSGGLTASLASSDTSAATVPPSLLFLEGSWELTFPVTTEPVTDFEDVTISANGNGQTIAGTIAVLPIVPIITPNPDTVISSGETRLDINLPVPAPAGGITYHFESSDTSLLNFVGGNDSLWFDEYGMQGQLKLKAAAIDQDTTVEVSVRDYPSAVACVVHIRAARIGSISAATHVGSCYVSTLVPVINDERDLENWLATPDGPVYYLPGSSVGLIYRFAGSIGPLGALMLLSSSQPGLYPDTTVLVPPFADSIGVVLTAAGDPAGIDSVVITSTLHGGAVDYTFFYQDSPHFVFQDLTIAGVPCDSVLDINEQKHILGYWGGEPYILRESGLLKLDSTLPGYRLTKPVAFNDLDWVAGQVGDTAGFWNGDTTKTGPLVLVGPHPGVSAVGSVATAINNLGDITGLLIDTAMDGLSGEVLRRGFAWFNIPAHLVPGQEIYLSVTDSLLPRSINDNRWIVGSYHLDNTLDQLWNCEGCGSGFWFQRTANTFPYSSYGEYKIADPEYGDEDIPLYFDTPQMVTNNKRTLAGRWKGLFLTFVETTPTSFRVTDILHSLPPPAGYSDPRDVLWLDINEQDDVAGRVSGQGVAVIDGFVYNLNCSSDMPPDAFVREARGITDDGVMIANGTVGGAPRGFVLGAIPTGIAQGSQPWQGVPEHFHLQQNYPNPFNPSTTIEYSLSSPSQVTIEVFNVLGQKVRTLVNEMKPAGTYRILWPGTNDAGQSVSTGVYFYRLQAGDTAQKKKMLFLK